jgi:hypothetical protein
MITKEDQERFTVLFNELVDSGTDEDKLNDLLMLENSITIKHLMNKEV